MRRIAMMTFILFVVSIVAGNVVLAGDFDRGNHHGQYMHGDDCDKYRHKYMKYKMKYKNYKKKYYHGKKKRDDHMLMEYWEKVKELDLSEEQMNQIHDLKFEWKLDKIDLRADIDRAKVKMHRLKYQGDVTRKELEQHIDQIYEAKAAYKKAMYNFKLDVNDQLTPEQIERIQTVMRHGREGPHDRIHGEGKQQKSGTRK